MIESEYVTILEAARRCGVSDKTIQRAIRRGTLPAQYPQPNRCEIAVADLEQLRQGPGPVSGHATESLERRIAALEQRVQDLEDLVQCLQMRQEAPKSYRASQAREQVTGSLPKQFISLLAFARLHNVTEAKALTAIEIHYVPVKKGAWTAPDGTAVTLALDAKGKASFYQLYRGLPFFLPCKQCPH